MFDMSEAQPGRRLPPGWNALVAAHDSLLEFETFLTGTDLDVVLCPEHSTTILDLLRSGDSVCSRRGCPQTYGSPQYALDWGWRQIAIGDESFLDPEGLLAARHDGLICERHFLEVVGHFL